MEIHQQTEKLPGTNGYLQRFPNSFNRVLRSSQREAEADLDISRSSTVLIIRNSIHLYLYGLGLVQERSERDYEAQGSYSTFVLENMQCGTSILN